MRTIEDIATLIEKPRERSSLDAQLELTKHHKLHINGDGYREWWLKKADKLESDNSFNLKKQLCRVATPRIYSAVKKQFAKVFRASGFVFNYGIDDKKNDIINKIDKCYNGKSLFIFMKEVWFAAMFEEFNGVVGVELKTEQQMQEGDDIPFELVLYPLSQIYDCCVENDNFDYIIFNVKTKHKGNEVDGWRYIDEHVDAVFVNDGGTYVIRTYSDEYGNFIEDKIENQLGLVPFVFVSEYKHSVINDVKRISPITNTISNAQLYQQVHDDHVLELKLHAHSIFYSYPVTCPTCNGTQKEKYYNEDVQRNDERECGTCLGRGLVPHWKRDVSQGISLPIGEDFEKTGFPNAPAPAGYVQRDIDALKQQIEKLSIEEKNIEKGCLGVEGILNRENSRAETATSRELDMQPLMDTLDQFSHNGQNVHLKLIKIIFKVFGLDNKNIFIYWGRKYFVKSEEQITKEMESAKKAGMNTVYLDELNDEITNVKFSHNIKSKYRASLLNEVQPLLHYNTIDELGFAANFADKYIMFMKVNFKDLIEKFEEENGMIENYGGDISLLEKAKLIKQKIYDYAKQQYSSTGTGGLDNGAGA